jgi:hypothetical protein
MRRRTLLQVGAAGTALLAVAGIGLALRTAVWQPPRLSAQGRHIFHAVARTVLAGVLPEAADARESALQAHVLRVEETVAGFPKAVQDELGLLLNLLASTPGRLALAGLSTDWQHADAEELQAMLQRLRTSSLDLRQQTYLALRDITYAAYFSNAPTWSVLGYAGPTPV